MRVRRARMERGGRPRVFVLHVRLNERIVRVALLYRRDGRSLGVPRRRERRPRFPAKKRETTTVWGRFAAQYSPQPLWRSVSRWRPRARPRGDAAPAGSAMGALAV